MDVAAEFLSESGRVSRLGGHARAGLVGTMLLALAFGAEPAAAQSSAWEHGFAMYLMGASIDGNVGIGALDADVNASFSDILDHMELGLMMAYGAERDRWAIGVDAIYTNLAATKDTASGNIFEADANQAIVSLETAYRLRERLQILGGLRFNELETDIAVTSPAAGTRVGRERESWVDPYIGGRFTYPFAQYWTFTLRGDVGGFGVGSESAWQFVTRFTWNLSDDMAMFFGYRIIDVDYDDGEGTGRFLYDVQTRGPLIGFGWRF